MTHPAVAPAAPLPVDELIHKTLVDETQSLLARCTSEQRTFFFKIWPEWPERDPRRGAGNDYQGAYELIRRTIIKNERGRS